MALDFTIALRENLDRRRERLDDLEHNRVERIYSPSSVTRAFLEAFDFLGGMDSLAEWAALSEKNYESFLRMYATLAPKGVAALPEKMGNTITYISKVPPSPLNRSTGAVGLDTQEQAEDADFVEADSEPDINDG